MRNDNLADKLLEELIMSYAEGHADHICVMIKNKKKCVELFCEYFMKRCIEELGKEKVKKILNGGKDEK